MRASDRGVGLAADQPVRLVSARTAQSLEVEIGFATERGARDANEDYVGAYLGDAYERARRGVAIVVADGVGGSPGGREAAELTVRGFLDGYYGLPETLGVERAASRALDAINRWVAAQGRQDPALAHMATTCSALVLRGRHAHVIHVGDSRIYRLRDGRLACLTTDHTLRQPDLRHVLYRAVGIEERLRADYAVDGIGRHDRFLLCSDGVHGVLADRAIEAVLREGADAQRTAERLVRAALDAGGSDNATAVIVDVLTLPDLDASDVASHVDALPIAALPRAGDVVDGFQLGDVLSDGRYSRLFRARDTVDGRDVVLKFPHPRIGDEVLLRRAFVREAWIASRVESPWLGAVVELAPGRHSRLYSVMPYYQGETGEARLARAPVVAVEEGVSIGAALAKAVFALHRAGIIHRDIKPDNVLLTAEGPKLLDLGVARLPGLDDEPDDEIPGTPSYMAPELFDGEAGDERSDVYALGVTFYRLLSGGAYPYGEVEAFARPRFGRRVPLAKYRPDLPRWFDAALERATAIDRTARFGDALEFAYELEQGARRAGSATPRPRSLYERNPVLCWQLVAAALALALLAMLTR